MDGRGMISPPIHPGPMHDHSAFAGRSPEGSLRCRIGSRTGAGGPKARYLGSPTCNVGVKIARRGERRSPDLFLYQKDTGASPLRFFVHPSPGRFTRPATDIAGLRPSVARPVIDRTAVAEVITPPSIRSCASGNPPIIIRLPKKTCQNPCPIQKLSPSLQNIKENDANERKISGNSLVTAACVRGADVFPSGQASIHRAPSLPAGFLGGYTLVSIFNVRVWSP
jgi:hypothetical protein